MRSFFLNECVSLFDIYPCKCAALLVEVVYYGGGSSDDDGFIYFISLPSAVVYKQSLSTGLFFCKNSLRF